MSVALESQRRSIELIVQEENEMFCHVSATENVNFDLNVTKLRDKVQVESNKASNINIEDYELRYIVH